MEVLSKKGVSKEKCLSAAAPPWVPDGFPPLVSAWGKPITPQILTQQKVELEKKLTDVNKGLMDSRADVVRLEKRSQWMEERMGDEKKKHDAEIERIKESYKKRESLRDDMFNKDIRDLKEQNDRLRRRARLALEKCDSIDRDRDDQIRGFEARINEYREERERHLSIMGRRQNEIGEYQQDINRLREQLREHRDGDWISHSLKVKCILDEMKKSSVLPEDHAAWVYPMVEDIEIPHGRFTSNEEWIGRYLKYNFILDEVYKIGAIPDSQYNWINDMRRSIDVPQIMHHIRRRYLPSYEDAEFQDDGDEVEQAERIDEWTMEARAINLSEHFTNLLVEDRHRIVSLVSRIQGLVRGHQERARLQRIYGTDPVERNRLVTLIQKMFRGYLVRGLRYRDIETLGDFTYNCSPSSVSQMLRAPLPGDRVGIRFVNTGPQVLSFAWVRQDGGIGRATAVTGRSYTSTNISTYITHSFVIGHYGVEKFIRIPRFFKSGTVFDLHTGLTFEMEYWNEISDRLKEEERRNSSLSGPPAVTVQCQCVRCRRRREAEREEREEEERIQLAIMLSLEQPQPSQSITIDVIDYSDTLVNMLDEEDDE